MSEDPRDPPPVPLLEPDEAERDERARFLRPQPPAYITPRSSGTYLPGLEARAILGDRVIRS